MIGHKNSVVGYSMKEKSGRLAKIIFYFLRASKYHGYRVRATCKAVNQGDDKSMKISCILIFKGKSEFIVILNQELKKHM